MPERFELYYIDEHGEKQRPIMMHRAIFGSFERFIGLLIEHFKGLFPLWLAPVQVAVVPVSVEHEKYAGELGARLLELGMRVQYMDSTDTLGKRIREGEQRKIPYLLVIGDREMQDNSVAVRNVATKQQVTVNIEEFVQKTLEDIAQRKLKASIG